MPFFDGKSICAFSFAINSIHVGTLFQKKGYHGFVTIVRGPNQWRSEIESGVPSINICTCLDQVSCNANISVTHSFEKTLVPFSLRILSQKKLRHFLKAHASSSNNTQTSTTEKKPWWQFRTKEPLPGPGLECRISIERRSFPKIIQLIKLGKGNSSRKFFLKGDVLTQGLCTVYQNPELSRIEIFHATCTVRVTERESSGCCC